MTAFDQLKQLLRNDRSIRRFDASASIPAETLRNLVYLTRLCASGRNAQPLRYRIVNDPQTCNDIFPALAWAGYYRDWDGPEPAERPTAYLIQCLDTTLGTNCLCDDGLQLQAITLGATAMSLGTCIIKAFNADTIRRVLHLDERYQPRYVLALGYPVEKAQIIEMQPGGDFKYYRDENDIQCVPKRPLDEIII